MAFNAGSSHAIAIRFSPTAEADFTGQLVAVDSQQRPVAAVAIYGRGRRPAARSLSVSATSLDFGNVTVNATATRSFMLSSTGTYAVTIDSATVSGPGFRLAGASFPLTLQPGQSIALTASFTPGSAAAATGQISIHSNSAFNSTAAVSLSGTGSAPGTSLLGISSTSLSFGSVAVNASSAKTVTLTSSGTAPVTVRSIAIAGAGYTVTGAAFPVSLNPGSSLTLQVSFAPKTAGASTGTLTINSQTSTSTISLLGTGVVNPVPQLTLNASSLSFGSVTLNSPSAKSITLTSSGSGVLTISGIRVAGAGFSWTALPLPVKLNPGQSLSIQVNFSPTTAGSLTGSLTIVSDASGAATLSVPLAGTGTSAANPLLSISTATLGFGATSLGVPLTQTITLASTGTSAVTVSSASVTGSAFTISGVTFPVTLNPNVAVKLTVIYNPLTTGSSTGQITIRSNSSSGNTSIVNLTGSAGASQHSVTLTWNAPSNSPIKVIGYSIYRAVSGTSSYALLNDVLMTQTMYTDSSVKSGSKYDYYVTSVDAAAVQSSPSNRITLSIP